MKRRSFLVLLGATAAWPVAARAQAAKKRVRIGVLVVASPEPLVSALKARLQERGYVEGRNAHYEVRSGESNSERLPGLAAELVALKPDVLIGWQTPAVLALKGASTEIPIVMLTGDPVGLGLIASLARPGGNITGVSATTAAIGGKMLELIRETLPAAKRVAVLVNAKDPFNRPFLGQIQEAAPAAGLDVRSWSLSGADEYPAAFAEIAKWRADAVIVQPSLPREAAIALALKHRLPSLSPTPLFPQAGGLMSYAASTAPMYSEMAGYVDKILKGARPADLPVQQPTIFELAVNLKNARSIGITVPRALLLRADKVIE